jgi:hypothetical protein
MGVRIEAPVIYFIGKIGLQELGKYGKIKIIVSKCIILLYFDGSVQGHILLLKS